MTIKQAQRRLDQADDRLRMAGVSNLGMSAIYQTRDRHLLKLHSALIEYLNAWYALQAAKKRAPAKPVPERSSGPHRS